MEKRLKAYISFVNLFIKQEASNEDKKLMLEDLLIQIGFFQHERLIHLIVTALFAVLTVATLITCLFIGNLGLYALFVMLLVLLIPYIRHYYILENGVQKLYTFYDELNK